MWVSWALSSVLDSLAAFSSFCRRSTFLCSLRVSIRPSSCSAADRLLFSSSSSEIFFLRNWMWSPLLSSCSLCDFTWRQEYLEKNLSEKWYLHGHIAASMLISMWFAMSKGNKTPRNHVLDDSSWLPSAVDCRSDFCSPLEQLLLV